MKIAHFAIFAPHACGQYETVKDLILAERQAGIDARFIDYGFENKPESRTGLKDGIIETQPLAWAKEDADIGFFHSSAPPDLNISLVCALHGRPENSFRLEYFKLNPVISFLQAAAKKKKFQAYVTFWPEYTFYWSRLLPGEKIYHVPAPVNFDLFSPDGPKHDFGTFAGEPNIVIADMWREDYTPFNLVFAAQYFKEHFYPKAKLHIYGVPRDNTSVNFLSSFKKMGLMGEIWGIVPFLDEIYRSADMVITPNIIATRIIRESLASGTPVVAPRGCSLTEFKGEPRDIKDFATAMKQCWESKPTREDVRQFAYQQFNPEKIGNEIKKVCERVINQKKPLWNDMSIRPKDWSVIKQVSDMRCVENVVEFGSGVSTKLFVDAGINVESFETDFNNLKRVKQQSPTANIHLWDGKGIPKISGDLAFIDGPHGGANREPAYKAVAESNIPVVICHDAHRPEDRQWIEKYFKGWWPVNILTRPEMAVLERPC